MRWLALVSAAILATAGCAKKEPQLAQPVATSGPTSSPDATASAGAAAGSPGATTSGRTTAKPGAAAAPKGTTGPVASARPGGYNLPKPGTYVYALSGTRKGPQTSNQDKPYAEGANQTVQLSVSGNEYKTVATDQNGDDGSQTSRLRLEATRVLLLQLVTATPFGDINCTYEPPVEVFHLPPKVETFPTQSGGSPDKCKWEFKIDVKSQESVTDANGKSWSTWKVQTEVDQTINTPFGVFQGHVSLTSWISQDLGSQIRSDSTSSFNAGSITSHRVTALKSHP